MRIAAAALGLVALLANPGPQAGKPPRAAIARVWHGRVAAEYAKYLDDAVRKFRGIPGNRGYQMMRENAGAETHFMVISFWESRDAEQVVECSAVLLAAVGWLPDVEIACAWYDRVTVAARWCQHATTLMVELAPRLVSAVAPSGGRVELRAAYGVVDPLLARLVEALRDEAGAVATAGGRRYGESLGIALAAHLTRRYVANAPPLQVAPLRVTEDAVEVLRVRRLDAAHRVLEGAADVRRRLADVVPVAVRGELEAVLVGVVLPVLGEHLRVLLVPRVAEAFEEEEGQDVALPIRAIDRASAENSAEESATA